MYIGGFGMKEKKKLIIDISDEILTDFELNRIPFQQILMKCSRLSRLVGDMTFNGLIEMELSGYEYDHEGKLTPDSWICGELVGRTYHEKDKKRTRRRSSSIVWLWRTSYWWQSKKR